MSEDRVATARRQLAEGLDAFNRGDLEGGARHFADDARYQVAKEHPESRVCVGREEIVRYQQSWFGQMGEIRYEVSEVLIDWPYGLVLGQIRGRGVGSGIELSVDLGLLYELDDEVRAISAEEYLDLEEARRRYDDLRASAQA
jgi:ketosteroid isomerase-like protein